jgi:hypothetical protein
MGKKMKNLLARYGEIFVQWIYLVSSFQKIPHDHLLLDSDPNFGPLISGWELDKFKNY